MRSKVTHEQFDAEVERVARTADRARDLALQKAERVRQARGAAAVRELARLRARDGTDAEATVGEAARVLGQARGLAQLREEVKATSLGGRVTPDRTLALGRVISAVRQPTSGLRVLLSADGRRPVAEATVDETGMFVVEGSRDEFKRLLEGAQALVITVRDAAGNEVHKTSVPVRTAGVLLINLEIGGKPGEPGPAPTPEPTPGPGPRPAPSLADIRGLGDARIARLKEAGVREVADLARMTPDKLVSLLRVSAAQAEDFIGQAKRLVG
jgi:hypothetical protein